MVLGLELMSWASAVRVQVLLSQRRRGLERLLCCCCQLYTAKREDAACCGGIHLQSSGEMLLGSVPAVGARPLARAWLQPPQRWTPARQALPSSSPARQGSARLPHAPAPLLKGGLSAASCRAERRPGRRSGDSPELFCPGPHVPIHSAAFDLNHIDA